GARRVAAQPDSAARRLTCGTATTRRCGSSRRAARALAPLPYGEHYSPPSVPRIRPITSDTDWQTRCRLSQGRDFHDRSAIEVAAAMDSVTALFPMSGDEMDGAAFEADGHGHRVVGHGPSSGDILHAPPVLAGWWIVGRGHGNLEMDPLVVRIHPPARVERDKGGDRVAGGARTAGVIARRQVGALLAEVVDVDARWRRGQGPRGVEDVDADDAG